MEWDIGRTENPRWLGRGFCLGSTMHFLNDQPDSSLWAFIVEEDGKVYWTVEGLEDTPKSGFAQADSVENAKAAVIVTYRLRARVI